MSETNADACKAVIDAQAAKGMSKYRVPLERAGVTLSQLAEHGAQEAADLLAYMVELKRRAEMHDRDLLAAAVGGLSLAIILCKQVEGHYLPMDDDHDRGAVEALYKVMAAIEAKAKEAG